MRLAQAQAAGAGAKAEASERTTTGTIFPLLVAPRVHRQEEEANPSSLWPARPKSPSDCNRCSSRASGPRGQAMDSGRLGKLPPLTSEILSRLLTTLEQQAC